MCFLTGSSPPDFHLDPKANIETRFKGRTTLPDLSETARIMMGFWKSFIFYVPKLCVGKFSFDELSYKAL